MDRIFNNKILLLGILAVFILSNYVPMLNGIETLSNTDHSGIILDNQEDLPLGILWTFDMNSSAYGGGAIDDIDNDEKMEIVFGTYMGDSHIYAINAENGTLLWKFYAGPGPIDASVKICDITGNGFKEVIFAGSGSGYMQSGTQGAGIIHVLNGTNGEVVWEYNTDYCTDSPVVIVDIDQDDTKEVIYGAWKENDDLGYVRILNGKTGALEQKIGGFDGYIQSGPTILDLDGNGQLDIVIATFQGDNKIYAINGSTFDILWSFQANDWMYHGGSFADIDGDGLLEISIGSYDDRVYVLNAEDGSLEWSFDVGSYILAPTSLADVNHDGNVEVIAATNSLHVLSYDGTSQLWSYPTGGLIWRGASIADIDGDGRLDVCFASEDGILRVLNGTTGSEVWSFDVEADYGNTFEIDHAPIIADFNDDGYLDVFIAGGYGVYPPDDNYGRAYAFSIGNGTGVGWKMFRHDLRNSGYLDTHFGQPPNQPTMPTGPTMGTTNVSYAYSTSTIDPDGELLYFQWDWDDEISPWYGPYDSEEYCNRSHLWELEGTYAIRVRAKDQTGQMSNWSHHLNITISNRIHITNLSTNWNFISIPFNTTIEKINISIFYNNMTYTWNEAVSLGVVNNFIFGWNRIGQYYSFANRLEPGYGYWIYANNNCELRVQNISPLYDSFVTETEPDWNIIGIPSTQQVNKYDLLVEDVPWDTAVSNYWISDYMFGWNEIGQSYMFSDVFESGKAYWLYAYQQCVIKQST